MAFKKGVSGNPGGRPKSIFTIEAAASKHSGDALARLVTIMNAEVAEDKDRIAAAKIILERAFGRPRQSVDATVTVNTDLAQLMEAARARVLAGL